MNLPNKLTILRIIGVVPLIILWILIFAFHYHYKLNIFDKKSHLFGWLFLSFGILFTILIFTDFLDGKIARKRNQITLFGKLFDPLADKIIINISLIMLSFLGIFPFYFVIIFLIRDLFVNGFRNIAAKNNQKIAALWWGKIKTLTQSLGLIIIFFSCPFLNCQFNLINPIWIIWILITPLLIAMIFSLTSGYFYFLQIKNLIIKSK